MQTVSTDRIPVRLYQGQLGVAQATLYATPVQPPNIRVVITSIWVCNTDLATRTCTLRTGAGTLTAANALFEAAPIAPNTTYIVFENTSLTLNAGDVITGLCDVAAKMTVTIYGVIVQ